MSNHTDYTLPPGTTVGYGYVPRAPRLVQYIGVLPTDGEWHMTLVPTTASKEAVVLADKTGKHAPRIIKDGKLTVLCP
jgi:hypothetical protein